MIILACRASRLCETDQRRKGEGFGLIRKEFGQDPRQVQNFRGIAGVGARPSRIFIGLGIGDFERGQNRFKPLDPVGGTRHIERHSGIRYLALGSNETLRQGGFANEKCARYFLNREAANQSKRQCNARIRRYSGVAANENQPQSFIWNGRAIVRLRYRSRGFQRQKFRSQPLPRSLTSKGVERATFRDPIKPSAWIVWNPDTWPGFQGCYARLGEGVFCQIQVAKTGRERGDDAPTRFPDNAIESRVVHVPPRSGRISIEPS